MGKYRLASKVTLKLLCCSSPETFGSHLVLAQNE